MSENWYLLAKSMIRNTVAWALCMPHFTMRVTEFWVTLYAALGTRCSHPYEITGETTQVDCLSPYFFFFLNFLLLHKKR